MADIIENDLGRFDNSIQRYISTYTKLEQDYASVVSLVESLNGMWTGQAHDALIDRFKQDKEVARTVLDFAKDIQEDLQYAHSEYTKCESKVRGLIDSIQI